MSIIFVTPLSAMLETLQAYQPTRLVTLLSPEHMIETPEGFPTERHLRLGLNDIADPAAGDAPPEVRHVAQLISFARAWDGDGAMLIHCWAGVSRSMAAAFTVLCDHYGPGTEYDIAQEMRARASHAAPNRLLVRLADSALNREGRMIRAVEGMGPCRVVDEGVPVEFPLTILAA